MFSTLAYFKNIHCLVQSIQMQYSKNLEFEKTAVRARWKLTIFSLLQRKFFFRFPDITQKHSPLSTLSLPRPLPYPITNFLPTNLPYHSLPPTLLPNRSFYFFLWGRIMSARWVSITVILIHLHIIVYTYIIIIYLP